MIASRLVIPRLADWIGFQYIARCHRRVVQEPYQTEQFLSVEAPVRSKVFGYRIRYLYFISLRSLMGLDYRDSLPTYKVKVWYNLVQITLDTSIPIYPSHSISGSLS